METIEKQSFEVEQTVIGMILQDSSRLDVWGIASEDFAEPLHAELFEAIQDAHRSGKPHNPVTLCAFMQGAPAIRDDLTVPEYIRGVFSASFRNAVPDMHTMLKDFANRRRVNAIGQQLIWAASETRQSLASAIADGISQLDTARVVGGEKKTKAEFGAAMAKALDDIANDNGTNRLPIGVASLDQALGGWYRGQFVILAGRPGMGKSMLAQSLVLKSAQKSAGVMMFSLEMTIDELAKRGMSDLSYTADDPIPYRNASRGMDERHFDRWSRAAAEYARLPLVIDDKRGLTISEISARARAQKNEWECVGGSLDIVVVDHLGLIRPSDRYKSNKVAEVGEISDGLATMAKELDVCVIALSQLNRGTEGRENKRPSLADLRNSGDLEQDAHVVVFAYREAYYLERLKFDDGSQQEMDRRVMLDAKRNSIEFLISKNRNGPTETVNLFCDPSCNVIRGVVE
jgi:replicative DNA helicase